jgi:4-carboxymuconolactone decarboxylase
MSMPPAIDPQSCCRLPLRQREELDEAGQRAYDRANTPGLTIVGLRGPAGLRLYSTKTVEAHHAINHHLRYEAGYDPKVREIAILTVAREMDSRFEWAAHEPEALKVGVAVHVVDVIKYRKSTTGLSEIDAAIIEFGRQAVGKHKVEAAAFARLKALFTPEQLVDLVLLMGNYAGTAILLAAFDMQVAEGRPLLPVN